MIGKRTKDSNIFLNYNNFGLRLSQVPPGALFPHFQMTNLKLTIIAITFKKENDKIVAVIL